MTRWRTAREDAWRRARGRAAEHRRAYLGSAAVALLVAGISLAALSPAFVTGLDAALRREVGRPWWDALVVVVALLWLQLGASYLWVVVSGEDSPPLWWIPWVR